MARNQIKFLASRVGSRESDASPHYPRSLPYLIISDVSREASWRTAAGDVMAHRVT
jgi:hypothetical protein